MLSFVRLRRARVLCFPRAGLREVMVLMHSTGRCDDPGNAAAGRKSAISLGRQLCLQQQRLWSWCKRAARRTTNTGLHELVRTTEGCREGSTSAASRAHGCESTQSQGGGAQQTAAARPKNASHRRRPQRLATTTHGNADRLCVGAPLRHGRAGRRSRSSSLRRKRRAGPSSPSP